MFPVNDLIRFRCYSHLAELPDPPASCVMHNETVLEVTCQAGNDGGLSQHFMLEVTGGQFVSHADDLGSPHYPLTEIHRNEISTMNDQVNFPRRTDWDLTYRHVLIVDYLKYVAGHRSAFVQVGERAAAVPVAQPGTEPRISVAHLLSECQGTE